jgi:hypothetical protein
VKRLVLLSAALSALATCGFLLIRPSAQANPNATITVNSTADSGPGTLRQALLDAQTGDTILFDTSVFPPGSPATITLGSTLPALSTGNISVDGSAAGVIVDGGSMAFACLDITSHSNVIKGLEIYNCCNDIYIHSGAQNSTIGGTTSAERNVISGNNDAGVLIEGSDSSGNTIQGNFIGTDASGSVAIPNLINNIRVHADGNSIGGEGEGNLVSGAIAWGIEIRGSGNVLRANLIGTDAGGTQPLSNGGGIDVDGQDNTIGGAALGAGNVVAFNRSAGVVVFGMPPTGNTIRGNSIHSNEGKGIAREYDEPPPPIIDSVGGSVSGHTDPKCYPCTVEVFSDDEDEGRIYHGSTTTNDDATGTWTYAGAVSGPHITATITDATGNTSEFSVPMAYSPAVGGIAELPDVAQGNSSARNFIVLAGFVAVTLLALTAGAWYTTRRRGR